MEEDIKILEEKIDYFRCYPEGCNWKLSFEDNKEIKAIENLIKGYKEKDKIIDLMARQILNYDNQLVISRFKDKEHVKELFTKEASDENVI